MRQPKRTQETVRRIVPDWTPIKTSQPPQSGVWQVTTSTGQVPIVEQALFQHPDGESHIKTKDGWLRPGWYRFDFEPIPEVHAWMPSVKAYTDDFGSKKVLPGRIPLELSKAYPIDRRRTRIGDAVTAAQVVLGNTMFLDVALNGGTEIQDDLQLSDIRMAIDTLFEALFGEETPEEYKVILFSDIT